MTTERILEHGPAGVRGLPRAVMLSVEPVEPSGTWHLELLVDAEPMPAGVRIVSEGGEVVYPLAPTDTPNGRFAYATFALEGVLTARVEILDGGGAAHPALSFLANFATAEVRPLGAAAVAPPVERVVERAAPPAPVATTDPGAASRAVAHLMPFDPPCRQPAQAVENVHEWPESFGAAGSELGPRGASGRAVLTLVDVATTPDGARMIEVLLEDEGLIGSLVLACHGREVAVARPRRVTSISPARVRLAAPAALRDLVLAARDPYGEVYPNLVAAIDVDEKRFAELQADAGRWRPLFHLRAPLDLASTQCPCCRVPVDLSGGEPWNRLAPAEREALRAQFPLTPDARALCRACHEEHVLSQRTFYLVQRFLTSRGLLSVALRAAFAYAGATLVLTGTGFMLCQFLDYVLQTGGTDFLAWDAAAGVLAFLVAVLPWPTWCAAAATGWRRFLAADRRPGMAALVLPTVVALVAWVAWQDRMILPAWYMRWFWIGHVHGAALAGLIAALIVTAVVERAVEREAERRLSPQRDLVNLGKAGRRLPELLSVVTLTEYERAMDRILIEGLGALEFQAFARDGADGPFHQVRYVGSFRGQIAGLRFQAGEPHALGQCARLGFAVTADDIGKGQLLDPGELRVHIPFRACVPIWAAGRVAEVYCVTGLRGSASAADVRGLVDLIALAAGRGLHRLLSQPAATTPASAAVTAH